MKLVPNKRKYYRFPKLADMYQAYRKLLATNKELNYSFFKFWWKIKVGNCELCTFKTKNNKDFHFVLFIQKHENSEKDLEIKHYYITKDILKDVEILQAFRMQINSYSFSKYETLLIKLPIEDKVLLSFMKNFIGFEKDDITKFIHFKEYFEGTILRIKLR